MIEDHLSIVLVILARMARTTTTATAPAQQETKKANNQINVMVSYSHADQEFCHKLVEGLQKGE